MGMDFNNTRAIYLQISDWLCAQILSGKWTEGERIPSVRELAVQLEVNPNTVMRSYDMLQNQQIIVNKRGVGFFVVEAALNKIKELKKSQFVNEALPELFQNMSVLGISLADLTEYYNQWSK